MKQEISAGGIVVRKSGSVWEVLVMKDMNDNWTFPKGLVEKGEEPAEAAKREIKEEVGISQITLFKELKPIHYFYNRKGLISKTVHYFLFTSSGLESPKAQKEEGISEVTWMPMEKTIELIGYAKSNKPLLEEVETILRTK